MGRDLLLRFESSPGHFAFIFFYNQQVTTIHTKVKLSVPWPPWVARSVRERPQDRSEYRTIELIALRLRDAWVGKSYLGLQTRGSLNSCGIRETQ
jgi:hypothetical protein